MLIRIHILTRSDRSIDSKVNGIRVHYSIIVRHSQPAPSCITSADPFVHSVLLVARSNLLQVVVGQDIAIRIAEFHTLGHRPDKYIPRNNLQPGEFLYIIDRPLQRPLSYTSRIGVSRITEGTTSIGSVPDDWQSVAPDTDTLPDSGGTTFERADSIASSLLSYAGPTSTVTLPYAGTHEL